MEWPLTCNQLRLVLDDLELFDPKMVDRTFRRFDFADSGAGVRE